MIRRSDCLADDARFLARVFGITPEIAAAGKAMREARRHDGPFPRRNGVRAKHGRVFEPAYTAPKSSWAEDFERLVELWKSA